MLPKARVPGVMTSLDWVPMPVREIVRGTVDAEVATESVPERMPAAVGVKVTWMVQEALGASELPGVGQVPDRV